MPPIPKAAKPTVTPENEVLQLMHEHGLSFRSLAPGTVGSPVRLFDRGHPCGIFATPAAAVPLIRQITKT